MLGCCPLGKRWRTCHQSVWWFYNLNPTATPACGLDYDGFKQWDRFCWASFIVQCGTVAHVHVMCGLSLESWAVCHVGRSCETGAEMKRLAVKGWGVGSRVCLLHGCSDRPLVFFQRVWMYVCESEKPAHITLGIVQVCVTGNLPLYHCTLVYAAENNLPACACSCVMW